MPIKLSTVYDYAPDKQSVKLSVQPSVQDDRGSLTSVIMYTIIKSIARELKFKNKRSQFESLQEYTTNLEKLYTERRVFRHDYINILSSIVSFTPNTSINISHSNIGALNRDFINDIGRQNKACKKIKEVYVHGHA